MYLKMAAKPFHLIAVRYQHNVIDQHMITCCITTAAACSLFPSWYCSQIGLKTFRSLYPFQKDWMKVAAFMRLCSVSSIFRSSRQLDSYCRITCGQGWQMRTEGRELE